MSFGVGEEVKAAARRFAALGDGADELVEAAGAVLLIKTGDLGLDGFLKLQREEDVGFPVDIGDGNSRRDRKQREVNEK